MALPLDQVVKDLGKAELESLRQPLLATLQEVLFLCRTEEQKGWKGASHTWGLFPLYPHQFYNCVF